MEGKNISTKIEAKNVRKIYCLGKKKEIAALDSINLKVKEQEFVSIVGPSGCGKTTFLEIVGGLNSPSSGKVCIDGKSVNKPGFDRGFVFQHYALFPWRNVMGNVSFGLEVKKVPKKELQKICKKYVSLVGLSGFEHHFMHELSGGMKQRVAIARALAYSPDILLMDEPFGSLDEQTRKIMQDELLRIQQVENKTIIFVTHSIDEAIYLGNRVAIMSARPGKIKKIIDIDLPKPRYNGDLASSRKFIELRHNVWDILKNEVIKSQKNRNKASRQERGLVE